MLSRNFRLAASRDIQRVQKQGKTVSTPYFRIKTLPNTLGHLRATIIIPNKFTPSVVVRNRKRRQVAAILRELKPEMTISHDIIIAPTQQSIEQNYQALKEDLITGFQKIGFLQK